MRFFGRDFVKVRFKKVPKVAIGKPARAGIKRGEDLLRHNGWIVRIVNRFDVSAVWGCDLVPQRDYV